MKRTERQIQAAWSEMLRLARATGGVVKGRGIVNPRRGTAIDDLLMEWYFSPGVATKRGA